MTSVSFFHVSIVNNHEENAPEGGILARFYRPGGGGFELFFGLGGGEFAHQKNAWGFCPGGWSGLELTDT